MQEEQSFNRKSIISPLTSEFFNQLSKLEEGFHLHVLDKKKINALIQQYAKLVEFYDFHKDPIKNFFIDRIQFVLSRPETIKQMFVQDTIREEENEDEQQNSLKLPKQMTVSRAPSIDEQIDRKNVIKSLEDNSIKSKTRGQQMNLTLEIQKHKKEQEPSLNKLMQDYTTEKEKMDQYIQSEMKQQTDAVQMKLELRKKKKTAIVAAHTQLERGNPIFRTENSEDESSPKTGSPKSNFANY